MTLTAHQVDELLARSAELARISARLLEAGAVDDAFVVTDAALDARSRAHAAMNTWTGR